MNTPLIMGRKSAPLLLLLPLISFGQNKITGQYHDYFGSHLNIKGDSTFHYKWHVDTQESWTNGIWTVHNDTIYLTIVPKYDTVRTAGKNGETKESVTLSRYSSPKTQMEIALSNATEQNRIPPPSKLVYRKSRLYLIQDGLIQKAKRKGFWGEKKYPTWYYKRKN